MSATDVLLIGPTRLNLIKKVIKRFLKTEDKLLIHSGVKNTYLANYKELNLSKSLDVIEDSSQHTQTTEDDFSE
jgi:hypothetical protein